MKKILNSTFILALLLSCISCGQSAAPKNSAATDTLTQQQQIQVISALAKIRPEGDIVELSSAYSGIVKHIFKIAGDSVQAGDIILQLESGHESLNTQIAKENLRKQQALSAADRELITGIQAEIIEKQADLSSSIKLLATGAETRQNIAIKQKELAILQSNLQVAEQKSVASQQQTQALQLESKRSALQENDRNIRAEKAGLLLSSNYQVGSAITAYSPFARIAYDGPLIIEGEIDEMFASKAQIGQQIKINYVGDAEQIAQAEIYFLSPILDEKSFFYETVSESTDRRVRRFKAYLKANKPLLINAKVECSIQLKAHD